MSDQEGRVHGGHLVKGENPVLITGEGMIAQTEGLRIVKGYDPGVEMNIFIPREEG